MDIDTYLAKSDELAEIAKRNGKDLICDFFRKSFEEYPDIKAVRWTQYAPYFNDGDPCVFSVNSIHVRTQEESDVDEDDDGVGAGFRHVSDTDWTDPRFVGRGHNYTNDPYMHLAQRFNKLSSSCESLFQAAFGDDCTVTIGRDLVVTIDECDHD